MLRDHRRHVHIHRPGQRRIILRAELAPSHEDDVADLRQLLHRRAVEQVAGDGLDAGAIELFTQARLR